MAGLLQRVRNWYRQRQYKPGRVISQFIARDVKREIRIVSIDRINEGLIKGQVRTQNVLYLSKGLEEEQDFGETQVLEVSKMWKWSGQPWGGLPDGSSIADQVRDEEVD